MADPKQEIRPLSRSEKAAILFLCMDEQTTADLFEQMDDMEIKKVTSALLNMSHIPASQIQGVIEEFSQGFVKQKDQMTGGDIYVDGSRAAQNMISRTLSRGRGQQILSTVRDVGQQSLAEEEDLAGLIGKLNSESLYNIISQEHPQVIAIALTNARKKIARDCLQMFDDSVKVDIISRMARLEKVSGQIIDDLRLYITQKIASLKKTDSVEKKIFKPIGIEGLEDTVKMLKGFSRDVSMQIVESVEDYDDEIGAEISKRMFVLEDLERVDGMGIREILRNITNDDLKIALKDASETLQEKIFGNMSERAAMILKEDMEVMGPLKVEEIDASRQNIMKVAKNLLKEGKLQMEDVMEEEE